jgi:hypothetical protein
MSVSKNDIKFVQSLRLKKFRQKYNNFIAEGEKIAGEALLSSSYKIIRIFALPEWLHDHATQLTRIPPAAISEASENELAKISGLSTPNKVLMVLEWPQPGELPHHPNRPVLRRRARPRQPRRHPSHRRLVCHSTGFLLPRQRGRLQSQSGASLYGRFFKS